jgi:hypothetical protein
MRWLKLITFFTLDLILLSSCGQAVNLPVSQTPSHTLTQIVKVTTSTPEPLELSVDADPTQPSDGSGEMIYPAPPPLPQDAYVPPPTETPYTGPTYTPSPTRTPTATPTLGYTPNVTLTPLPLASSIRLPAPLYYLYPPDWDNPDTQVWRLEQDGITYKQITHETKRVRALDISRDGRLAYISENDLIVVEANGDNRKVLIAGGPYPENKTENDLPNQLKNAIENPIWSPDGQFLAVGWNGVKVIELKTGQQTQISPENKYLNGVNTFNPIVWTPSGNRIVIWIGYYEGGSIGIARPITNSPIQAPRRPITVPFDSEFSFLSDGRLLFGNNNQYMTKPNATALWIVDPEKTSDDPDMAVQKIIKPVGTKDVDIINFPKQATNGRIYFFVSPYLLSSDMIKEKTYAQLAWIDPSQATEQRQIHPIGSFGMDPNLLTNLLWAPDGSLAVYPVYRGNFVVIRSTDGAAYLLDVPSGADLHWGAFRPKP